MNEMANVNKHDRDGTLKFNDLRKDILTTFTEIGPVEILMHTQHPRTHTHQRACMCMRETRVRVPLRVCLCVCCSNAITSHRPKKSQTN